MLMYSWVKVGENAHFARKDPSPVLNTEPFCTIEFSSAELWAPCLCSFCFEKFYLLPYFVHIENSHCWPKKRPKKEEEKSFRQKKRPIDIFSLLAELWVCGHKSVFSLFQMELDCFFSSTTIFVQRCCFSIQHQNWVLLAPSISGKLSVFAK